MQGETEGETVPRDGPGTVTWMSYAELGRLRGTSAASAKRFANRKRWRKQPGNDGTVRVAVPPGGTVPRETARATGETVPRDHSRDNRWDRDRDRDLLPQALAALEDAVSALREQLDAANARAERAEADRADERLRADGLRGQIDAARAEAERLDRDRAAAVAIADEAVKAAEALRLEVAVAQRDAQAGQQAAAELRQAEAARKARGLLARLRGAWRGG